MGSEFSLLLFLSIRYAPPFSWLGTSPSRPLTSSSHWRPSPSLLPPLPRLLPLGACRPFPPAYSFPSLCRAPHPSPLTCCLPACLVSLLLHPLPRCLSLPPSSDFPSTHGFPPTPPFFRLSLFRVGFFFFLMVPGLVWVSRFLLGLPLPWLTRRLCVCLSLSCSCSYLRLASLSPASPPLSLRLWVIQRILCFLPLLPVFQGVIPVPLDPSTPPLAVGSARSSCCSNFVCFCAFFPLTLAVTPSASLSAGIISLLASCGSDVSLTSTTLFQS